MLSNSPQPNLGGPLRLTPLFWGLLVATGVAAGIAAGLLMWLLHAVQHLTWHYRSGGFFDAVARAPAWQVVAVPAAGGVLIGFGRRWLRQHVGGHGGEVGEAIWLHQGHLDAIPTLARAVLSIVGVGMGAALGREGAPKQAGAVAASLLAGWAKLEAPQCRLLAACGAGAGMAAVYDVPFGGALFALEVLLGGISLPLVLPALAASAIATATSWLMLPHAVNYDVSFAAAPGAEMLAFACLGGPVLGVAAVGYVRIIAWADGRKPRGWRQLAMPVVVLAALGLCALRYPQLLGNGKDVVTQTLDAGTGLGLVAALLPLRVIATALCLASGAPGGLFTPTLAVGALLGAVLGHAAPGLPPGTAALLGAAGFLAAAAQGPVSAMALTLELTRRIDPLAVPLLLAIAGAAVTARMLEQRSIYSARLPR